MKKKNTDKSGQKQFKFRLIIKISLSLLTVFSVFFFIVQNYVVKQTVKKNIRESSLPLLKTICIQKNNEIDSFFKKIEKIGGNSLIFTKKMLNTEITEEEIHLFSEKHKFIDGAIRSDLTKFKSEDVSAIFLSNKNILTKKIKKIIIQTGKGFGNYAKGVLNSVFNMYFISKDNMIRIYKKDWAMNIDPDHTFEKDIFYSIGTPENNKTKTGKWTYPYYDSIWKRWMTSYIIPVYIQDEFVGIIGHDIILDNIYKSILNTRLYKTGNFIVFDSKQNIILSSKIRSRSNIAPKMGTKLSDSRKNNPGLSKAMKLIINDLKKKALYNNSFIDMNGKKNIIISKKTNFLNWYIAVVVPEKEMMELFPKFKITFIILALSFLSTLLFGIILIIFYIIIQPIKKLTSVIRVIQKGNLSIRSNINTKDEIGELSFYIDKMTSELEESLETMKKDILIRKETEKALNESNEKFKKVFDNSPYMIVLSRQRDGKIVNVNFGFETLTGYKKDESIGRTTVNLDLYVDPEQRKDIIYIIEENGYVKDFKFLLRRKDNIIRHCLISSESIEIDKEKHIVSIIRDITDQEEAKKEKILLEEQLEQSKKMEILGTLAGGVAHDLNNILSGLVSYPDLLLTKIEDDSPMKRPLTTIKKSGKKAAAIVQDLLTLARRGVSNTSVVNLNDLIDEYLSSLEFKKLKSFHPEIIINKELKDNLFNIIGSKVHLTKTIMNLVSNAAEAMKTGGKITIITRNQYIDKETEKYEVIQEGNYSIIEVKDEGIGISSKDIERIFEPFYTKKKMGKSGTGLGMAVVWGTIKDHKGFIDIDSSEGEGTSFTLYFPITNKELSRTVEDFDINEYQGNGEKILVVDDILEQRELAYDILTRVGYTVNFVESGEEAIRYLKKKKADLVLLDMIMDPGIDGLDTYKKILKLNPNQKTVVVSGFSETERVQEAIKLGVLKYIKKPYSVELLSKAIKNVFTVR